MHTHPPDPPLPGWLDAVLEHGIVGAYAIGPELRFGHLSPRCAHVLGRTADELLALPSVLEAVAPADRERVRRILAGRLEGRPEPARYAYRARRPDGTEVPVEVHECAFERAGVRHVAGVVVDASERSQLEAQLRRSQRMEAVGELTGAVAHDFNNLLTAMLTPVELVITELGEEHPLSAHLLQVRRTVLRAAGLTRQLLRYSRDRVHRAEVLRMGDLLEDMLPLLNGIAGESIDLDLSVASAVPHVVADPTHVEQVVVNLLVNARDAMGGTGRVRLRVERERRHGFGEAAVLVVEDEGPGVPEGLRDRIFDPFFTTKEEGTGLGLSTVAGIVRESRGEIRVEGAPGGGARFVVALPAAAGPASRVRPRSVRRPRPEGPARCRILLLDDERDVRRVVAAALKRFGHDVVPVADGDEALAVARAEGPTLDLILSDVQLPRQSGVATVRELLPLCPRARVIFATGALTALAAAEAEEMEGAVWLEKPFSIDELLDAVRRAIGTGPAPRRQAGDGP